MSPRRRSPILPVTLAALAVFALLCLGIYLGGHPEDLPTPLRSALVSDDVKTTQEAFDAIKDDYFRKVTTGQLVNDGIAGAVRSLDDRFSNYLDPTAYRRFVEQAKGRFSGIGTEVVQEPTGLRITRVFPASPAAKAGIHVGDHVVAVGGKSIAGRPSQETTALIRGRPGTFVTITIESGKPPRRREA